MPTIFTTECNLGDVMVPEKYRRKTICPLDCPDTCGMIATVAGDRVLSLEGDRDHPYTNGFICRKMRRYPERVHGPLRLLYPQRRVGGRGTARFERISWDQALDEIAERLTDLVHHHGGQSILPWMYAGNMGHVNRFAGYPLFHRLGTTMIDETICSAAASAGWRAHCGDMPGTPPEQAVEAELIVAWGINIKVTNVHFWQYVARARKKSNAQLVVIDPYRNQTAASAQHYFQVRPAGDAALALGLLKTLIDRHLVDRQRVSASTIGFEVLEDSLDALTWGEIVAQSGIERPHIEALATLLHTTPRTFVRIGMGATRNSRGGMAVRAITALAAALGLFSGTPGQGVLLFSGAFRGNREHLAHPSLAGKKQRTINMIQLGHALTALDPPVRALLSYNANPLCSAPDSSLVRAGMAREDLFTVVHEQVMTPTARYADLVLPATTFLENRDLYTAYGHFYLGIADPVIPPVAEAMSNFDFFQALARRMGLNEPAFEESLDERMCRYLEDMDGLPKGGAGIPGAGIYIRSTRCHGESPSPKVGESYSFSSTVAPSLPSVPCLTPSRELQDPDRIARYPYMLITPPHPDLLNSTFGEAFGEGPGKVLVHPEDAEKEQVRSGDLVELRNDRGRCLRLASVSEATRIGLLVAEGLFWPTESHPCAVNDLTSQNTADMGGGALFHESRVALSPWPAASPEEGHLRG